MLGSIDPQITLFQNWIHRLRRIFKEGVIHL
jgi:hypothetical protein